MLQPELKFRRDKIRYLMAQQGIDAALIACNVNLLYTYGEIVNGYLFLPLHSPALLFVKRPNNIVGEFVFPIRKPEQMVDLLKENGIPVASKIMLEGLYEAKVLSTQKSPAMQLDIRLADVTSPPPL